MRRIIVALCVAGIIGTGCDGDGAIELVADTQAPLISAIAASNITASSGDITWTTDEQSDSTVEYGKTTSYGSSTPLYGLTTSHLAPLIGLSAGTLFHYRVKSRDAANNLATSPDQTFTTSTSGGGLPPTSASIQIGEPSVLTADDSGNGNLLVAQQASLGQSGTLQSLSLYVTAADGSLRLGVYDATGPNGGPGAKKAETSSFTPVVGWNTAAVTTPVSLVAGNYWLAYLPSSNVLAYKKGAVAAGVPTSRYYSYTFGPMPATFSTTPNATSSHWSFYATLTTTVSLPGPFNVTAATAGNAQVQLTWSTSSNAASYTVKYGTSSGSYPTTKSTSATSPYTVAGLTNGTTYYFMVTAVNASGSTNASFEQSAKPTGGTGLVASGPIAISGQSGTVISGLRITSTTGDCVKIVNSTNITIQNSEIGPCSGGTGGNGVWISGGNGIHVYDSYIHPETLAPSCCDSHDGILINGGAQNVDIQGNVIAYGESNIEALGVSYVSVIGNFLLNPRGPFPRGQNFQSWNWNNHMTVRNNYALSSTDTTKYLYAEGQEDSINFGATDTATAEDNLIVGGHSGSGCGLIADMAANSMTFRNNRLLNTGQCGIGIADGTNALVTGNKIYNTTPVSGGGNVAIYVWKQSSTYACGPTTVSDNIADEILSNGTHNPYWNGGGCEPVTLSGNTWSTAADALLTPTSTVFAPPMIPPQPKNCVTRSPYSNQTSLPGCM